jgi:hypothetical protein
LCCPTLRTRSVGSLGKKCNQAQHNRRIAVAESTEVVTNVVTNIEMSAKQLHSDAGVTMEVNILDLNSRREKRQTHAQGILQEGQEISKSEPPAWT